MPKSTAQTAKRKTAAAKAKVTQAVRQTANKAKTAKATAKRKATVTAKKVKPKIAKAKAKGTQAAQLAKESTVSLIGALAEGLGAIKETILPSSKSKKK